MSGELKVERRLQQLEGRVHELEVEVQNLDPGWAGPLPENRSTEEGGMSDADAAYQQGYDRGFARGRQHERDGAQDERIPEWARPIVDKAVLGIVVDLPDCFRGGRFERIAQDWVGYAIATALAHPKSATPEPRDGRP